MAESITFEVKRITHGPQHHLFGFHDICAWNKAADRLVALQVDNIDLPPSSEKEYGVGYVTEGQEFVKVGTTSVFNYPQGARQQWIGNTNQIIVNDIVRGKIGSKVYDTDTLKCIKVLEYSTHVITDEGWAFGLDYARLHTLGVYGYEGVEDETRGNDVPENSGIVKHNIYTGEYSILLSAWEVARFEANPDIGKNHYITHLVLSPSQKRIAFLHRCKLGDGGEMTRLCTVGINGENLKCLTEGFLSHFDWHDDKHILIWGRQGGNVEKLRQSLLYRIVPNSLLSFAKKVVKTLLSKNNKNQGNDSKSWLYIEDKSNPEITKLSKEIMPQNGHPMFCPTNRDWLICDTYPSKEGMRELFVYNIQKNKKVEIGTFKMIDKKPNLEKSAIILKDIAKEVLDVVGIEALAFTRSGLHCDLHPRWSPDGRKAAFDSIHEGTRQIYQVDIEGL
jgi:hypothetical protein